MNSVTACKVVLTIVSTGKNEFSEIVKCLSLAKAGSNLLKWWLKPLNPLANRPLLFKQVYLKFENEDPPDCIGCQTPLTI